MSYEPNEIKSPLYFAPPHDSLELCSRLDLLVGRSLAELSILAKVASCEHKGFAGQLLELFLGAHAHNLSCPDFVNLGIELKSLPISSDFKAQESTFICSADLSPERYLPFVQSALYHKMKHMLFVLLHAPRNLPLSERRILGYFFFKPEGKTLEAINADYNEFCELIFAGEARNITGALGNIIQMRPKAANSQVVSTIRDNQGQKSYIGPKAYYLRTNFTNTLLTQFVAEQGIDEIYLDNLKSLELRASFWCLSDFCLCNLDKDAL